MNPSQHFIKLLMKLGCLFLSAFISTNMQAGKVRLVEKDKQHQLNFYLAKTLTFDQFAHLLIALDKASGSPAGMNILDLKEEAQAKHDSVVQAELSEYRQLVHSLSVAKGDHIGLNIQLLTLFQEAHKHTDLNILFLGPVLRKERLTDTLAVITGGWELDSALWLTCDDTTETVEDNQSRIKLGIAWLNEHTSYDIQRELICYMLGMLCLPHNLSHLLRSSDSYYENEDTYAGDEFLQSIQYFMIKRRIHWSYLPNHFCTMSGECEALCEAMGVTTSQLDEHNTKFGQLMNAYYCPPVVRIRELTGSSVFTKLSRNTPDLEEHLDSAEDASLRVDLHTFTTSLGLNHGEKMKFFLQAWALRCPERKVTAFLELVDKTSVPEDLKQSMMEEVKKHALYEYSVFRFSQKETLPFVEEHFQLAL
ncbi:hypothetical protein [Spongorhabdus nitratireducens]